MKILIIDDDEIYLKIAEFIINSTITNSEIIICNSGIEATKLLESNIQSLSLIICDYLLDGINGDAIFKLVQSKRPDLPFIICSTIDKDLVPELKNLTFYAEVKKNNYIDSLQSVLQKFIKKINTKENNHINNQNQQELQKYLSINGLLALKINELPCDFFIRISQNKFIKIFGQFDFFTQDDFNKYKEKNITEFYYLKEDKEKIEKSLVGLIKYMEKNVNSTNLNLNKNLEILSGVKEIIRILGPTEEVQTIVRTHIENTMKFIDTDNEVKKNFSRLFHNKTSYLSTHSFGLGFLTTVISEGMNWNSEMTLQKLITVSLLHDLSLEENFLEYELSNFQAKNAEERKLMNTFHEHSLKTSNMIIKIKGLPPDSNRIVLEHHEKLDGTGFPRKLLAKNISPLGQLFIFCHTLIDQFYLSKDKKNWTKELVLSNPDLQSSEGYFPQFRKIFLEQTSLSL